VIIESRKKYLKSVDSECNINLKTVNYLGIHSFFVILSRKQSKYQNILKILSNILNKYDNKIKKGLCEIINPDNSKDLFNIKY
jgi:hypothetical protein